MNGDPITFLFEVFSGSMGFLFLILWLVSFLRLGDIRDQARRQTKLLEEIATQGRKPVPPKLPSSVKYEASR